MFSYLKSIAGFGDKSVLNGNSSANEYIDDAFSDDSSEYLTDDENKEKQIGINGGFNLNDLIGGDKEDEDLWNEEWNAVEDIISGDNKKYFDVDSNNCFVKGVVTQLVNDKEIVVDNEKRIQFDMCNITDLSDGDLVNVETDGENRVTVKPLRYKIMTAKITEYDRPHNRFIFSKYAFIRNTSSAQHLSVGDVLKCVVIETRTNRYNWRAYPYNNICDPSLNTDDKIVSYTNELMENKSGIEILKPIDFGSIKLNTKQTMLVWIKNKGQTPQTLVSVNNEEGESQIRFYSFHQHYGKRVEPPYVLPAKSEAYVELICETEYCGDHNELLIFQFDGFKIGRYVSFVVLDFDNQERNSSGGGGARCDTTYYRRRHFGADTWIMPGEKLYNQNKHIFDKLEKYLIPKKLWETLENNWSLSDVFPELFQPLDKLNYRKRFHALLYLEECENQMITKRFDMEGVSMKRDGRFFAITVPGLADGRPSLILGDKVIALGEEDPNTKKTIGYEGFIHEIRRDEILVRFNEELHRDFKGGIFKIVFQVSRMVFRRCHHAIDLAPHMVEQVLFPTNVIIKQPFKRIPIDSINWYNPSLNTQQKLAVVGALRGECRPTPYIIFGPPGTGKTVTIVESILQVFSKIGHSRVIACTAANSSADLIVQKLLDSKIVTEKDLIRITAFHRVNSVPAGVQCVTKVADEDPKKWIYHRIIVTTSSQAGVVFRHKISPSHFTHVFIDEAGQVTEPESLIPISMSVIGHGVVVLAGDHQQLGPVVVSSKAKSANLDRSLMERLMTCFKTYERKDSHKKYGYYNPKFVVKLVNNYRSDKQIMEIPSNLFYENELKFQNETDHKLLLSAKLSSPVIFVGVDGDDCQDRDCPSWYNPQEVITVCTYLDKLYLAGVDPKDIGIITPYRKQVSRIRTHMHDMGLVECRVATIEEFQGLEKRVIILSMVRSMPQNVDHDIKYNLGFIHNSKRFNVAVSRAMSLLIVIGNPLLLSRDKCWAMFLDYCLQHKCYTGIKFREHVPKNSLRTRFQNNATKSD